MGQNGMPAASTVVVDIGGTSLRVGTASSAQPVSHAAASSAAGLVEQVTDLVRAAVDGGSCRVGVACAGVVEAGRVTHALNLPLTGVDLERELTSALGGRRVLVANDANVQAVGCARDDELLLYITCGTSIGAAVVHRGSPLSGAAGGGGEIAHMRTPAAHGRACPCGRTGCLDTVASGRALEDALGPEWYRAAPLGADAAGRVLAAGEALGGVLVDCALLLSPDRIVVAGRAVAHRELRDAVIDTLAGGWWPQPEAEFAESTWRLTCSGLTRLLADRDGT